MGLAAVASPSLSTAAYVIFLVAGVLGALNVAVLYLSRPAGSARSRGPALLTAPARVRRIALWAAGVSGTAVALAVVGALVGYAIGGPSALVAIGQSHLVLGLAVAVELAVFCAVVYAVFLLERTGGAVLPLILSAALTGLVAAGLAALVAIPLLHAVGAVLALVIGLTVKSTVLLTRTAARCPAERSMYNPARQSREKPALKKARREVLAGD